MTGTRDRATADFSPKLVGEALSCLLKLMFGGVVSIPLITTTKQPIGMLSVHFASPHSPTEIEMQMITGYAHPAADALNAFWPSMSEDGSGGQRREAS